MPWCTTPIAASDLISETKVGINGDDATVVFATGSSPWTLATLVSLLNDNLGANGPWSLVDGCVCTEDTTVTSLDLVSIPSSYAMSEKNEVDPAIQACLDCFEEIFGCDLLDLLPDAPEPEELVKADIAAAVLAGIDSLPDQPAQQIISAEIVGWNQSGTPDQWDPPTDFGTPVPALGAIVNPAGIPGQQIGSLFIDPNLPAGSTTFDLTYTILDSTGGMGSVYAVEKSTGIQVPGGGYASGAGGPTQGPVPFDHTVSFVIPPTVDATDVCVVIDAFGVAPIAPSQWGADEIDPSPEALVVVTPSPCANAAICFEDIFGCTISELVSADEAAAGGGVVVEPTEEVQICVAEGMAVIDGVAGTLTYQCGVISAINKVGVGVYDIGFSTPLALPYPVQITVEESGTTDDIMHSYTAGANLVRVILGEQDNGTGAGVPRDRTFSLQVGAKTVTALSPLGGN